MPMVFPCSVSGCSTLTMGAYCLEHEPVVPEKARVRRPHLVRAALLAALAGGVAAFAARTRLPV